MDFSVTLACGQKSNENITYMEMASTTTPTKSCEYELCPTNSNVARIRLDFEVHFHFQRCSKLHI